MRPVCFGRCGQTSGMGPIGGILLQCRNNQCNRSLFPNDDGRVAKGSAGQRKVSPSTNEIVPVSKPSAIKARAKAACEGMQNFEGNFGPVFGIRCRNTKINPGKFVSSQKNAGGYSRSGILPRGSHAAGYRFYLNPCD